MDPGEGPVGPRHAPRLLLDQNEVQGAEKFFRKTAPPPLLSEGLDLPLK